MWRWYARERYATELAAAFRVGLALVPIALALGLVLGTVAGWLLARR